MEEKFLEKFWGKPISVLFLFLILGLGSVGFIPDETKNGRSIWIYLFFAICLFLAYVLYVIRKNSLPRCKQDEVGVLFIFKIVSEEQYKEFKFIIEENFKEKIVNDTLKIVPICLNASSLKNYNRDNAKYMKDLLNKTNCYFCVEFFVESDSANNPTNYQTTINTGVLHSNVSKESIDFMMKNVSHGAKYIHKIQFDCSEKIRTLEVTTEYLGVLTEYVISCLLLIHGDYLIATPILDKLHQVIGEKHVLYRLVSDALYNAAIFSAGYYYEQYYKTSQKDCLERIEENLNIANEATPDGYDYHLNMANVLFLKNRDIKEAKRHIAICKQLNKNDHWKYSSAFLTAYESNDPNITYSKYNQLKNNSYNIIEIIYFIESVLEHEPKKVILRLALGILYDTNGDATMASYHFKCFLNDFDGKIALKNNTLRKLKRKIIR